MINSVSHYSSSTCSLCITGIFHIYSGLNNTHVYVASSKNTEISKLDLCSQNICRNYFIWQIACSLWWGFVGDIFEIPFSYGQTCSKQPTWEIGYVFPQDIWSYITGSKFKSQLFIKRWLQSVRAESQCWSIMIYLSLCLIFNITIILSILLSWNYTCLFNIPQPVIVAINLSYPRIIFRHGRDGNFDLKGHNEFLAMDF